MGIRWFRNRRPFAIAGCHGSSPNDARICNWAVNLHHALVPISHPSLARPSCKLYRLLYIHYTCTFCAQQLEKSSVITATFGQCHCLVPFVRISISWLSHETAVHGGFFSCVCSHLTSKRFFLVEIKVLSSRATERFGDFVGSLEQKMARAVGPFIEAGKSGRKDARSYYVVHLGIR